jgi:hypothetical protein
MYFKRDFQEVAILNTLGFFIASTDFKSEYCGTGSIPTRQWAPVNGDNCCGVDLGGGTEVNFACEAQPALNATAFLSIAYVPYSTMTSSLSSSGGSSLHDDELKGENSLSMGVGLSVSFTDVWGAPSSLAATEHVYPKSFCNHSIIVKHIYTRSACD